MANKIYTNHTLEEYKKKYRNRQYRLLKITKKEVEDFHKKNPTVSKDYLLKDRKWWLIGDTYYEIPKAPRYTWFRNLNAGVQIATCALLGAAAATAVVVPTVIAFNNKTTSKDAEVTGTGKDLIKNVSFSKQSDGSYKGKIEIADGKSKSDIEKIIIKAGNKVLEKGKDYKIDDNTGDITINAGVVTNNDNITIEVVKKDSPVTPTVTSIAVDSTGIKTHNSGDSLDLTGIKIKAHLSTGTDVDVDKSKVTFNPKEGSIVNTTHDVSVTATYEGISKNFNVKVNDPIVQHTVSFIVDGVVTSVQTVNDGEKVTKPDDPIKTGYTFKSWNNGDNPYNFNQPVTADLALNAVFGVTTYTITYNLYGGTNNPNNPKNYTIETEDIKLKGATKDTYTFAGWYDQASGGNKVTEIKKGSYGNKTLYARWNDIKVTKVEITNTTTQVKVGEQLELTSKVTPDNATNPSLTWTVDTTGTGSGSIVTKDNKTYLKGVTVGTVTVTASAQDGSEVKGTKEFTIVDAISGTVTISGTAKVGQTLTAAYSGTEDVSYQWYRGETAISGETSKDYKLVDDDLGQKIKVKATGVIPYIGTVESAATSNVLKDISGKVTISGKAKVGETLTANYTGTEDVTYQWYRGDTEISGATNSTYMLVEADSDFAIKVKVTGNEGKYYIGSVESKPINITYFIDWCTTRINNDTYGFNDDTLYEKALIANKLNIFASDSSAGALCGETADDKIYAKFYDLDGDNVLDIWSKKKISFEDNDKPATITGFFDSCSSVTSFDFSNVDTSKVKDFGYCFYDCGSVTNLDLTCFDTSMATNMEGMFWFDEKESKLNSVDMSSFDTSNVTNMSNMFDGCSSLTSLDISSFDTSKVTTMDYMFSNCSNLKSIYVSDKFTTHSITNSTDMFSGCDELVGGNGTKVTDKKVYDATYAKIDKAGQEGYFTQVTKADFVAKANEWVTGANGFCNSSLRYAQNQLTYKVNGEQKEIISWLYKGSGENRILQIQIQGKRFMFSIADSSYSGNNLSEYLKSETEAGVIYKITADEIIYIDSNAGEKDYKELHINKFGYPTYKEYGSGSKSEYIYSGDPQ